MVIEILLFSIIQQSLKVYETQTVRIQSIWMIGFFAISEIFPEEIFHAVRRLRILLLLIDLYWHEFGCFTTCILYEFEVYNLTRILWGIGS